MKNRLLSIALSLGLLASLPAVALAGNPDPGGFCSLNESGNNYQVVIRELDSALGSGSYFDRVEGRAVVRPLLLCLGANGGASYILPANLEDPAGSGKILQLGYGQTSGQSRLYFVKAEHNGGAAIWLTGAPAPITGHRYWFIIYRNGAGNAAFKIIDKSTDPDTTVYSDEGPAWSSTLDRAWYGAENQNEGDGLGALYGTDIDMWDMGYSKSSDSVTHFVTGLTSADVHEIGVTDGGPSSGDYTASWTQDHTWTNDTFNPYFCCP